MICKSAVLVAIATLLTAGGMMHLATSSAREVGDSIVLAARQDTDDGPVSGEVDIVTDDEDANQATPTEALHHHLILMHHRIHLHAHHLLHWLHGGNQDDDARRFHELHHHGQLHTDGDR